MKLSTRGHDRQLRRHIERTSRRLVNLASSQRLNKSHLRSIGAWPLFTSLGLEKLRNKINPEKHLRHAYSTKPGERPEVPFMFSQPSSREQMTKEYQEMNAERQRLGEELWKYDNPADKFQHYLKLNPELAEYLDTKMIPTGFEQVASLPSSLFVTKPEEEMSRELTPKVKADIHNFVITLLEFLQLEETVFRFPDSGQVRLKLRPYLKEGCSDALQPADAPVTNETIYDFSRTPTHLFPPMIQSMIPNLCKGLEEWYVKRPNTPIKPTATDEFVGNSSLASAMNIGEWMSAYIVGAGMPAEDYHKMLDMLSKVDHQAFAEFRLNREYTEFQIQKDMANALKDHASQEERLNWFKQYCEELHTLRTSIKEALGPEGIDYIKFKQKHQERHEKLLPKWGEDLAFPISNRKQPDQPLELAAVLMVGQFLDREQSETELKSLKDVNSWEGLWAWHIMYRDNSRKVMPKAADRREMVMLRKELNNLVVAKYKRLRELAEAIDFFRVHPLLRSYINSLRLNWQTLLDVVTCQVLPIHPQHETVLAAHSQHLLLDTHKLVRKTKIALFQFNDGLYVPQDLTGESVWGNTPFEDAVYTMPKEYPVPGKPELKRQVWESHVPFVNRTNPEHINQAHIKEKIRKPFFRAITKVVKRSIIFSLLAFLVIAFILLHFLKLVFHSEYRTLAARGKFLAIRALLFFYAGFDWVLFMFYQCVVLPAWLFYIFVVRPVYHVTTQPAQPDFNLRIIKYNEALETLQQRYKVERAIFEKKMLAPLSDEENERVNAVLFRSHLNPALPAVQEEGYFERKAKAFIQTYLLDWNKQLETEYWRVHFHLHLARTWFKKSLKNPAWFRFQTTK